MNPVILILEGMLVYHMYPPNPPPPPSILNSKSEKMSCLRMTTQYKRCGTWVTQSWRPACHPPEKIYIYFLIHFNSVNPSTPNIWLVIISSSCYTFPCMLVKRTLGYLTIILFTGSEVKNYCRIIPKTKGMGLFDNIH